jgi:transcriptional regulator with XRE-family HTH domain
MNRVKMLRQLARLTQDELGRKAHVDHARVSRIERGYVAGCARERRAISQALGFPEAIVFGPAPDEKGHDESGS